MDLHLKLLFDYNPLSPFNPSVVEVSAVSSDNTYDDPTTLYGTALYATGNDVQFYNNVVGSSFVVALRYTNTSTQAVFNLNFAVLEFKTNERR